MTQDSNEPFTVLFRKEGCWTGEEASRIAEGLGSQGYTNPGKPEYLVLAGHYPHEQIFAAMLRGSVDNIRFVNGRQSTELPFAIPSI